MNRHALHALLALSMLTACAQSPKSAEELTASDPPPTDHVTHELEGTRWVPLEIGGKTIVLDDEEREQFIVLQSMDHSVVGNAGCNRLRGGYETQGSTLRFSQVATTRMACPAMARETSLIKALESTASWRITGAHLDLFDGAGALLARFESRNL